MATGGPNNTSPSFPVVDFVPQKSYPSFSSLVNQPITITSNLASAASFTAAQVLGGFITSSNAAAQTLTLPTAALLVPSIEGGQVNSSIRFFVQATTGTSTVAVGTGGTFAAGATATVAAGSIRELLLVITAVGDSPSYTVYSLGTSVY
jgi:hypothetical protein